MLQPELSVPALCDDWKMPHARSNASLKLVVPVARMSSIHSLMSTTFAPVAGRSVELYVTALDEKSTTDT